MPTGYTACISEGISFRTFVLRCARAMGACIMQRDDPGNEVPQIQEVSPYHDTELQKAKKRLTEAGYMSDEAAAKAAKIRYDSEVLSDNECNNNRKKLKIRYEVMLSQIRAWTPPTKDHYVLKEFMIDQISQSIEWDCKPCNNFSKRKLLSGDEWRAKEMKEASGDIEYHTEERNKEVKRTTERNNWITALYSDMSKYE
jgi:hypothetical protein